MKRTAAGLTLALVGNPNCGKTTLFNALTGANQQVGNWSGVTVSAKKGAFLHQQRMIQLIDLPGIYSLISHPDASSDEKATWQALNNEQYDAILYVLDAHHFERSLYLALQCLELGKPMIIALNRVDMAEKQGISLCPLILSRMLRVPVVSICARQNTGFTALVEQLYQIPARYTEQSIQYLPESVLTLWELHKQQWPTSCLATFLHELESTSRMLPEEIEADILLAQSRYGFIADIKQQVCQRIAPRRSMVKQMSSSIDKWICHRVTGVPLFFMVMYALFFFAINIGGVFQSGIEILLDALLVQAPAQFFAATALPPWLQNVLTNGIGKGVVTVLTFVPVLAAMFFALGFLQESGYMSRAAFVIDRVMRSIGLPGKSFVPMIVGFGCNVPAVLGTRALDHRRERILTVMMSPFMSCGARLAIFTVFVSVFFPVGGENIIFLLYMIGISMAVLTGLLLKNTLLKGPATPFILDMPDYQLPHMPSLLKQAAKKTRRFVKDAIKWIVPVCILLTLANTVKVGDTNESLLEQSAKMVTPIFAPMGITEDNWPATVGLFTGVMAKEVVIGSLNTLYAPQPEIASESFSLLEAARASKDAVVESAKQLVVASKNPMMAKAATTAPLDQHVHSIMQQKFASQTAAFAYLLFVLLYVPCVSVMAAMAKEVSQRWTWFSVVWTTTLAYSTGVLFYQVANFSAQPSSAVIWIGSVCAVILLFIGFIRYYSRQTVMPVPTRIKVNPA